MDNKTLPLYPPESDLARAILGPGKATNWKAMAVVLERHGLPRVDPLMGGRYWPAVRAWLDQRNGLGGSMPVPSKPDGQETWKS